MRRSAFYLLAAALFWVVSSMSASAHRLNESYVYFNVTESTLSGRVEATLNDLGRVIDLDTDGDGAVNQAELLENLAAVHTHFAGRLYFDAEGIRHEPVFGDVDFLELEQGTFALLTFDIPSLSATPDAIGMHYTFLFDGPLPSHRGFALIESSTRTGVEENEAQYSLIFGPGNTDKILSLVGRPPADVFLEFVPYGIWSPLTGAEHLAVWLALLLPLVLRHGAGGDRPVEGIGAAFGPALALIAVMALVYGVTLALAGYGLLSMPKVFAAGGIALSIVLVALTNIARFVPWPLLLVGVFALGHGLRYAGDILWPLGVDQHAKPVAIAGFTLGMILAHLALTCVILPVLYALRTSPLYVPVILKGLSALIAAFAVLWFVERTYDLFGNVKGALGALLVGA